MRVGHLTSAVLVPLLLAGCATTEAPPPETVDLVTPLPANFAVQLPSAEIPRPLAEFSGIWKGDWLVGESGSGPVGVIHHTLVVARIEPSSPPGDYRARVVYSTGAPPVMWPDGGPGFWELWATLSPDGTLRMKAPGPDGGQATYTVSEDGKSVKGQYLLPGKSISGTFLRIR
jgi:hypothetical protein